MLKIATIKQNNWFDFFENLQGSHQNAINILDLEFENVFIHSLLECFISENNRKSN